MKNPAKEMMNDWLRTVETSPNPETNSNREKAIKKIIGSTDQMFWLNLLRLAYGLPSSLKEADFITHFKKQDESFPLANNENLLKVLANITICYKLETGDSELNHWLSLAITNCVFLNPLSPESHIPVIGYATENIEHLSGDRRIVDIEALNETIEQLEGDEEEGEEQKALSKTAVRSLYKLNVKLLEEVNILWWLYTGYSKLGQKSFSSINEKILPIFAAKELYDLMHIERLIESSPAFFKKVLGENAELQQDVFSSINSISEEDRKKVLKDSEGVISEFTPILKAMTLSLGFPTGDDWSNAYKKQVGGDVKISKTAQEIAQQLYREFMFVWLSEK